MSSLRTDRLGATLAVALSIAMLPTKGHAYTDEQQQACTPDAMRLCGAFVPDVDRITACMIQNRSQLSPECGRFFRPEPAPHETAAVSATGKPMSIKPPAAKAKKPKPGKRTKPAGT